MKKKTTKLIVQSLPTTKKTKNTTLLYPQHKKKPKYLINVNKNYNNLPI